MKQPRLTFVFFMNASDLRLLLACLICAHLAYNNPFNLFTSVNVTLESYNLTVSVIIPTTVSILV